MFNAFNNNQRQNQAAMFDVRAIAFDAKNDIKGVALVE